MKTVKFLMGVLVFLTSCKFDKPSKLDLPGSLMPHKKHYSDQNLVLDDTKPRGPQVKPGPLPYVEKEDDVDEDYDPAKLLKGSPIDISVSQMPLPIFIKTVFGDRLGQTIQLSPEVAGRKDLVTLRTGARKTPAQIYAIAKQVVNSYGVAIKGTKNVLKFLADRALEHAMPQILYSRTSSATPEDLRPVFQIVDIHYVDKAVIKAYLDQAFPGKGAVTASTEANAVILSGTPDIIRAAVDAIRTFDRPAFSQRKSVRVNLSYLTAENLTQKLIDILKTEGYNVSDDPEKKAAITLLPVAQLNSVFIFAGDTAIISHALTWIRELDVPTAGDPEGMFYYIPVKNTDARELGSIIEQVLSKQSISSLARPSTSSSSSSSRLSNSRSRRNARRPSTSSSSRKGGRIVVNEGTNSLIFRGTAEEYARILPLVKQMDVGVRQVLIEVVVAEYTANNNEERGIEWVQRQTRYFTNKAGEKVPEYFLRASRGSAALSIASGLTSAVTPGGFNFAVLNRAGQLDAVLHVLSKSDRSTILSTPRILTRSGGESEFMVGLRVPTLTTRSRAADGVTEGGTSPLVSQVTYEETGTLLKVKPTVHSGRRVDLEVEQTLSDVATPAFGNTDSPSFSKTNLKTKLSLKDGSSVLLGGFIRDRKTRSKTGIPILKDIPGFGALFRTDIDAFEKREILLLITPYILDNDKDAESVTSAFTQRLVWINQ